MKPEQILEALEGAAKQLGVRVRYEALVASGATGAGGLCKVQGRVVAAGRQARPPRPSGSRCWPTRWRPSTPRGSSFRQKRGR